MKKAVLRFRNEIEKGPGGKQIQLEDPDGNPIELFEPASSLRRCRRTAGACSFSRCVAYRAPAAAELFRWAAGMRIVRGSPSEEGCPGRGTGRSSMCRGALEGACQIERPPAILKPLE